MILVQFAPWSDPYLIDYFVDRVMTPVRENELWDLSDFQDGNPIELRKKFYTIAKELGYPIEMGKDDRTTLYLWMDETIIEQEVKRHKQSP